MFSSRLPDDLSENRLSRRVRELRAEGVELLDLTLSNPTRAGLTYPEEEIREAFARASALPYDPQPRGLAVTREAIAAGSGALQRADGFRGSERRPFIDPAHLHCTSSSSEAYSMLFKLLCDPGDEICIPLPAYPLFAWLAGLDAVRVRPYNLRLAPDGHWHIDMHSLDMAISDRTRAVIVVNPSNPAANYLRPDEFLQLDSLCARNRIALITDEVFWDFPLIDFSAGAAGIEAAPVSRESENVVTRQRTVGIPGEALRFTINGLSKLLALPQMKLGWILTEGPASLRDDALARLDVIADSYLSVSTPVMAAAPALLGFRENIQSQIRTRCLRNLETARALFGDARSGLTLLPPEGGWSALLRLPDAADEEVIALRLLEQERVLVHPGYLFDFARGKFLVVSLLSPEEGFAEGTRRLHSG
ncbi:MAG: pyridoxal phosphate-dependent aminotransferase [Bacteroidetes bacterium]|nr:pyridoxal phosphate-dependent aminotransferase [Bacteroidota bacterium]